MGTREPVVALAFKVCAPPLLPASPSVAPAEPFWFEAAPTEAFWFEDAPVEVAFTFDEPLLPEATPAFFAPALVRRVPVRGDGRGGGVFLVGSSKLTPREPTKSSMTFWSCCCCARAALAHTRSAKAASVRRGRKRIW